ncbi:MAG: hypothetical protein KDA51_19385, partial [Planctomycetales bacterium]|nr:hypothetical protein [Planctomycetales bacterium]
RGQLRLIPVITQDVATVLNTIKSLYGDRIEGNSSGGGGGRGGGGGGGQPDPAAFIQALRGGGGRGGGGNNSQLAEPKISLGADEANNMLIVMAQPKQIAEIEELVAQIDLAGAANEEVVDYAYLDGWVTTEVLQQGLLRILGPQARTSSSQGQTAQNSGSSSGGGGGDTSDAAAQARRAAFFESLRNGGGGLGGRGGTTGGGGGFTSRVFGGFGGRGGTGGGTGGRGGR